MIDIEYKEMIFEHCLMVSFLEIKNQTKWNSYEVLFLISIKIDKRKNLYTVQHMAQSFVVFIKFLKFLVEKKKQKRLYHEPREILLKKLLKKSIRVSFKS